MVVVTQLSLSTACSSSNGIGALTTMSAGTRDSQAQLVLGASGWVQHKEGGVLYSLDVTKCMFSSGNTTERQRMGRLQCAEETVVDLYAGIGYYTLPFLCKAGKAVNKCMQALVITPLYGRYVWCIYKN